MQATIASRVMTGVALPRSRQLTVALIIGFALLTAGAAQIRIPLPFTPVPITGQTFAVLLSGAALGSVAGGTSQVLYLLLGAVGLPFYAEGGSGWSALSGATGGYLVGFVAAAALVGWLAEKQQDRAVWSAVPAFLAGNAVIYLFGVPWLAHILNLDAEAALAAGFAPFVVGDLVKILLVGSLLPAVWKVVGNRR